MSETQNSDFLLSFHYFAVSDSCGKKLDSSAVNEHDQEIYCKTCYAKHFGAKGYGFAGGAAGGLAGDYEGRADFSANDSNNIYDVNQPEYPVYYWDIQLLG